MPIKPGVLLFICIIYNKKNIFSHRKVLKRTKYGEKKLILCPTLADYINPSHVGGGLHGLCRGSPIVHESTCLP